MLRSTKQVAFATAMAVAAAFPAAAQEVKLAAADQAAVEECMKRYPAKDREVACAAEKYIRNIETRTEEYRREGAQARREGEQARKLNAQLERQNACLDDLISFMNSQATDPQTGKVFDANHINTFAPDRQVTPANACETKAAIDVHLKKARRAEAPAPSLN